MDTERAILTRPLPESTCHSFANTTLKIYPKIPRDYHNL